MRRILTLTLAPLSLSLLIVAAPRAHAAITGHVDADISHPFVIGNKTLPAGNYELKVAQGTDQQVLSIASTDGSVAMEVQVRQSIDNHTPHHTELVFNRYGHKEFLEHVYEAGQKSGVTILQPSNEEARMRQAGQKAFEHTEDQK